jgi:hypothetical protein
MSNMFPAFHVFKDHKMEEINLSGNFRSHGEFIITPRLFSYIGDICVKSIILSDNAIKLIEGDALLNMKYKTCLRGMLEAYLTSASSLDVKLKILIQIVMAEKRLIPQNKFDRTVQILKFLLKCL